MRAAGAGSKACPGVYQRGLGPGMGAGYWLCVATYVVHVCVCVCVCIAAGGHTVLCCVVVGL